MQTLHLLDKEIGTMADAELIINDFHWFLTVDEMAGQWTVKTGETVVFTADSRAAVDAFLYGMALAYKGLPAHLYAKLFGMMAGGNVETSASEVELGLEALDADDERLSDLDLGNLKSPDAPTDDPFWTE